MPFVCPKYLQQIPFQTSAFDRCPLCGQNHFTKAAPAPAPKKAAVPPPPAKPVSKPAPKSMTVYETPLPATKLEDASPAKEPELAPVVSSAPAPDPVKLEETTKPEKRSSKKNSKKPKAKKS